MAAVCRQSDNLMANRCSDNTVCDLKIASVTADLITEFTRDVGTRARPKARSQHTRAHTTVLRLYGLCPGQPGWVGTRRNIHPLTLIVVINRPLSVSSI